MFRLASWFHTTNGRRFTYCCVGSASLFIFGNQIAAHGAFLDRVKDIFQVYSHGKPKPLPPKVHGLIEEVLQDSKLDEGKKKKLNFFYVTGHELFHAGGTDSPWGALIGVPFTFQDTKDINLGELKLPGKTAIDWFVEGPDLIKALTISDKAKKFALLCEIYSCKFSDIMINAAIGAGCFLLPARIAQLHNAKFNTFERLTLGQRSLRYFILYFVGFLMYRCLKDPLRHLSDREADRVTAETGIDYLDGGIEYYRKKLMKNKILGDILNTSVRTVYDEHGNESFLLLFPKLPITKRLENLEKMRIEKTGKTLEEIDD